MHGGVAWQTRGKRGHGRKNIMSMYRDRNASAYNYSTNTSLAIVLILNALYRVFHYPNATLTSEYDVTEQIYLTNNTNQIEASYSWVKDHQDLYTET